MKILNLSTNDYANMAHENAKALRSIGVDCKDYKFYRHNFNYATESHNVTSEQIIKFCKDYDVVQIFHTDKELLRLCRLGGAKKIVMYHTGTRYRQESEMYDKLCEGLIQITDQCEFVKGNNMHYLAPHVEFSPIPKNNTKLVVGHYPSNPINKGTDKVRELLEPYQNDFDIRIDSKIVPHQFNIKRMSECDIYVEMFCLEQDNKPFGCHGVTAFDAAALGSIVVTNNINESAYTDVYGEYPFLIANTETKFKSIFELLKKKTISLPSVFENHNIKSTGKRILQLIS
jgi:hypothetical protein